MMEDEDYLSGDTVDFRCSVCNTNLQNKTSLSWHIKQEHGYVSGISGKNLDVKEDEKINTEYKCEGCDGKRFKTKTSLIAHIQYKHSSLYRRECNKCGKTFSRKSILESHMKICQSLPKNVHCFFCGFSAATKPDVLRHYEIAHNIEITKKKIVFNTLEEFKSWKYQFEKDTDSRFVKQCQSKNEKITGVEVWRYCCQRDGNFQTHNIDLRHINTIRINAYCPASIIASPNDGIIKVVYIDKHVGHDKNLLKTCSNKLSCIKRNHKNALKFPITIFENDTYWTVYDEVLKEYFNVKPNRRSCSCFLRCQDCDACIHSYNCDCNCNKLNRMICRHIHLICMAYNEDRDKIPSSDDSTKTDSDCADNTDDIPEVTSTDDIELIELTNDLASDSSAEEGEEMNLTLENYTEVKEGSSAEQQKKLAEINSNAAKIALEKRKQSLLNMLQEACQSIENVETEEEFEGVLKYITAVGNEMTSETIKRNY